ncbi:hypothetical protein [Novosphingobium sp. BW1]|uniref:hypothetical protein n=1 Tax=Novosphingobium sp. BW1 TaxID=2592621 RepID=UPI0011DEB2F1|nr:hypothetical protein [Novosphingobium sp. BW1]TYC86984.1 hypothetical protein FMM79_14125 [Novosphingobium sp. BW1]
MLAHTGVWQGKRVVSKASENLMFLLQLRTKGGDHLDRPCSLGLATGDAETEARGGLPISAGSWSGSANPNFFADPFHDIVAILMTNELTPCAFEARTWRLREAINRATLAVAER